MAPNPASPTPLWLMISFVSLCEEDEMRYSVSADCGFRHTVAMLLNPVSKPTAQHGQQPVGATSAARGGRLSCSTQP